MIKPQTYKLRVPVQLAKIAISDRHLVNKYRTNRYLKNITSFIILKAACPFSLIRNYKNQINELAALCQCEKQTMYKRIQWMNREQLIDFEGSDIRLKSWKQVDSLLYCNVNDYKSISYDPTVDFKIHFKLFAVEIQANKDKQNYTIAKKLQQNHTVASEIKSHMLRKGYALEQLNDISLVVAFMLSNYRSSFKCEPALHSLLNRVRPCNNRSVTTISYAWNYLHRQSVTYVKKKMIETGCVRITKGERITSSERVRNGDCHVIWNKRKKQTVLALCDNITPILSPLKIVA